MCSDIYSLALHKTYSYVPVLYEIRDKHVIPYSVFLLSNCRNPLYLEQYVTNQLVRSNSTPYQWCPTSTRMTNTLDFILTKIAGSTYNISNVNETQQFEIWIDNRNLPADTNYLQQVGETTFPPNLMNGYQVTVPQNADLFVNALHLINFTTITNNVTNKSTIQILNNNFYSGINLLLEGFVKKSKLKHCHNKKFILSLI